jgi:pyruvate kinase
MSAFACDTVRKQGFAQSGDMIVVAAGSPLGVTGTTNMLKVLSV